MVEKLHNLPQAVSIIQSEPIGLRTRGANGVSLSLSPKSQKLELPMSEGRTETFQLKQRVNSPFLHLSVLFRSSVDWLMAAALLREIFCTYFINSNADLL